MEKLEIRSKVSDLSTWGSCVRTGWLTIAIIVFPPKMDTYQLGEYNRLEHPTCKALYVSFMPTIHFIHT